MHKISFTGSTRVGSLLMAQSATGVKRLSLELGGNATFIVFDDADLDAAVEGTIASKARNGGQTCVCANRILVHAGVHDAFAERLAARVRALRVGPGTAQGVDIGPMINAAALEKITPHIENALAKGATVLASAEAPAGQYATPTVLTGATTEMLLAAEETFGPVAPLFRFETEEEAIAIANGTPFRARRLLLHQEPRPRLAGPRGARVRHDRAERGRDLHRRRALRRRQAVRPRREGARAGIDEYLDVKALHIGGL